MISRLLLATAIAALGLAGCASYSDRNHHRYYYETESPYYYGNAPVPDSQMWPARPEPQPCPPQRCPTK